MDLYRSRQKAIKMLLESGDGKECSQMAFAVSSLESLAIKQKELQLTENYKLRKIKSIKSPARQTRINSYLLLSRAD